VLNPPDSADTADFLPEGADPRYPAPEPEGEIATHPPGIPRQSEPDFPE
jgi:hypothetical protein